MYTRINAVIYVKFLLTPQDGTPVCMTCGHVMDTIHTNDIGLCVYLQNMPIWNVQHEL